MRRCLAKDPEARWQSTVDLVDELEWIAATTGERAAVAPTFTPRRLGVAALVLISAVAIGAVAGRQLGGAPLLSEPSSVRFIVPPPDTLPSAA